MSKYEELIFRHPDGKIMSEQEVIEMLKREHLIDYSGDLDSHSSCFLPNEKELYEVFSERDGAATYVDKLYKSRDFPWIKINTFWSDDLDPDESWSIADYYDDYDYVQDKGISLVVIELEDKGQEIKLPPTITCKYGSTIHCIYRLRIYLPSPKQATLRSIRNFFRSVEYLERKIGGNYVFGRPVLNPFSDQVECVSLTNMLYEFKDFRVLTPEELEIKRAEGKKKQAEAGRATSKKLKDASVSKIVNAIATLRGLGVPITQGKVAEYSRLARRTVVRRWKDEDIQRCLSGDHV